MTDRRLALQRCTRRAVIATPFALLGGSALPAATAGSLQPAPGRECAAAPGIQLLVDFGRGLPVLSAIDLAIPAGWTGYFDPQLGIGYPHPPDWNVVLLWADHLTPGGAPAWMAERPLSPIILSVRAVAPSGDAAFETVVANLPNAAITLQQAATLARLGVTGDNVSAQPICGFQAPVAFEYDWVDAAFAGGATVMTLGYIQGNPGLFTPSATIVWYSLVAPELEFEVYVREVFARILVALIPGPEVVLTPTPTP